MEVALVMGLFVVFGELQNHTLRKVILLEKIYFCAVLLKPYEITWWILLLILVCRSFASEVCSCADLG